MKYSEEPVLEVGTIRVQIYRTLGLGIDLGFPATAKNLTWKSLGGLEHQPVFPECV